MAIRIKFDNPINVSAQVGDTIYAGTTSNLVGVIDVIPNEKQINVDVTTGTYTPVAGDFIMFQKDNESNLSSLVGYYAEVNLTNSSSSKKELFSIGSEVSISSK